MKSQGVKWGGSRRKNLHFNERGKKDRAKKCTHCAKIFKDDEVIFSFGSSNCDVCKKCYWELLK